MKVIEDVLWRRVMRFAPMLRFVPGVRMVAVCNSLALGEVRPESDIDLFIVARAGWLFRVRFLSVLLMQVLGVRRYGKKVAGRFCLSFYVDERALDLSWVEMSGDYMERWLSSLRPIVDDGVSGEFGAANGVSLDLSRVLWKPVWWLWFPGERFFRWWQMRRHAKNLLRLPVDHGVVVSERVLKFYQKKKITG